MIELFVLLAENGINGTTRVHYKTGKVLNLPVTETFYQIGGNYDKFSDVEYEECVFSSPTKTSKWSLVEYHLRSMPLLFDTKNNSLKQARALKCQSNTVLKLVSCDYEANIEIFFMRSLEMEGEKTFSEIFEPVMELEGINVSNSFKALNHVAGNFYLHEARNISAKGRILYTIYYNKDVSLIKLEVLFLRGNSSTFFFVDDRMQRTIRVRDIYFMTKSFLMCENFACDPDELAKSMIAGRYMLDYSDLRKNPHRMLNVE